jgi:hypothetical protein
VSKNFVAWKVLAKADSTMREGHLDKINPPTTKIATIDGETGQVIADAALVSRRLDYHFGHLCTVAGKK